MFTNGHAKGLHEVTYKTTAKESKGKEQKVTQVAF